MDILNEMEIYADKFNSLSYIWFDFVYINKYYYCNVYAVDEDSTPISGIVRTTYLHRDHIYQQGLAQLTIEDAFLSTKSLLDLLYSDYNDYTLKDRISDDIAALRNYTISPYHAVMMVCKQYEELKSLYKDEIIEIQKLTKLFHETSNQKVIEQRLIYANSVCRPVDFNGILLYRSCRKSSDYANILISIATTQSIGLQKLMQECVDKFNEMPRQGYLNQAIIRAYETTCLFPKKLHVNKTGKLSTTRAILTPLSELDIIVLGINVNREL